MENIVTKLSGIDINSFEQHGNFLNWFYFNISLKFYSTIIIIYISSLTIFRYIRCQHNSSYDDQFIDHYCLFNLTFITVHSENQQQQFVRYYLHLIPMLAILFSTNFLGNFVQRKINSFTTDYLNDYFKKYELIKEFKCLKLTHCLFILFINEFIISIGLLIDMLILKQNFNSEIFKYGFEIFKHYAMQMENDIYSLFDELFPIFTQCAIHTYGKSGNQINYDGLCQLRYNYHNRLTFLLIWLQKFLILILLTWNFFKKFLLILSRNFRTKILISKFSINKNIDKKLLKFLKHLDFKEFLTIKCLIEIFGGKKTKKIISVHIKHHQQRPSKLSIAIDNSNNHPQTTAEIELLELN